MSIDLLLNRNSAAMLTEPAPSGEALQRMFKAAMRAPDHGNLKPWRFITVSGDRRTDLGELFAVAAAQRNGNLTTEQLERIVAQPLRAPLLVVVVSSPIDHPKIPQIEQEYAAACAAFAILLAAEAEGFAGIWRTGDNAFDETVASGLGLTKQEQVVGFLYLGTRRGEPRVLPEIDLSQYLSAW
ncbi:MAG TPA: nitroreductase family protein [Pseudomonadales bacterium]|nr:nitroreductase family protein [Pseudomonadales bacterium]